MRNFLFRAWHLCGSSAKKEIPGMIYDESPGDCFYWKKEDQKITDIMQFTGKFDVDGVRIYEKDIVSGIVDKSEWPLDGQDCLCIVEWDDEEAMFYYYSDLYGSAYGLDEVANVKVIANTHKNPDMLELIINGEQKDKLKGADKARPNN